jgi:LmbE family N-acetylglucosaminyl deacetylase
MNVLFLSPHPDDAEIGAGGTLVRLVEEKHDVMNIVFSYSPDNKDDVRRREFFDATQKIGVKRKVFDYRIRQLMKDRQNILEDLISVRDSFSPDLVVCPSLNDFHQDHQVVVNETVRCFKKSCSIICYEIPWNHLTFNTNLFIKLKETHIDKKYMLMSCYKSQLNKDVFAKEYIFGLARVRGSQCGAGYAESFEVIRWMI